ARRRGGHRKSDNALDGAKFPNWSYRIVGPDFQGNVVGATATGASGGGMSHLSAEVAVVGAGPAGLTAAIALASAGAQTVLSARSPTASDVRTSALPAGAVKALDTLGVCRLCCEHAAPLRVMRIVDDTPRLLRAPEVCFAAGEIGLDAFGHNVENRFLVAALEARAGQLAAL